MRRTQGHHDLVEVAFKADESAPGSGATGRSSPRGIDGDQAIDRCGELDSGVTGCAAAVPC